MIVIVIPSLEAGSVDFLTICAVPDDKWNGLFDANPMVLLCDSGRRFVNPGMSTLRTQVAAVDDGVNECVRRGV